MGSTVSIDDSAVERRGLVAAVEQAADGIVITDTHGEIQYVNPAFAAMTGYSCGEVVGQHTRIFKSGLTLPTVYNELWSALRSGRVWHGEVINRRKDGSLYTEEMRITPVRDLEGRVARFIAVKQDVTKRREAESAQAFLAAIVDSSEDAIVSFTRCGAILTWNHGAARLLGYAAEDVIGKPMSRFVAPERAGNVTGFVEQVGRGVAAQRETMLLHKSGRTIHAAVTGSPVKGRYGEVVAISVIVRDITERLEAEQELRESEDRFRNMADSCPSMMWVTGAAGDIEFINRAFRRFLGVSGKEMKADEWRAFIHPQDLPDYIAAFECAVKDCKPFTADYRVRRADGEWRLVGSNADPRISPSGEHRGYIGLSADITERKQAESALQRASDRLLLATRAGG